MERFRFHTDAADIQFCTSKLQKCTKMHLKWFTENLGVKFNSLANVWLIQRQPKYVYWVPVGYRLYETDKIQRAGTFDQNGFFQKEKNYWRIGNDGHKYATCQVVVRRLPEPAKDICILGTLGHHKVEYWRHETLSLGAGQTLIYFNGRRFQVSYIERNWPEDLKKESVTEKGTLTVLVAHPCKTIQQFAKSLLS